MIVKALLWVLKNPLRALSVVAHVLNVTESLVTAASPLGHELKSLVDGKGLPPQGGAS